MGDARCGLYVRRTLLHRREVALTMVISAASNCRSIAAKKNCVLTTSNNLRVNRPLLQQREVALTLFIIAASNCTSIAEKKH